MSLGRHILLRMAESPTAREAAERVGARAARRFVAGDTLEEAVAVARSLNGEGFAVSLDHLGESVRDLEAAERAVAEYLEMARAIRASGLSAGVSLKLTQLGLDVDREAAYRNLARVARQAADEGVFVRIDMESSPYVEPTLAIYRRLRDEGIDNVGVVLQAYLRRSLEDLRALAPYRPSVRIVKGAYEEPAAIAYQGREEIRRAYRELLEAAATAAGRVAVATHDDDLVTFALALLRRGRLDPARTEFQTLYGVRPELARRTLAAHPRVRIYLPYGRDWFPYFMRRLAERPRDAWTYARLLLRAAVGG
ncbi:MAG: proline dehydrogenase family protein [Clostridia bacterium]|nr:proline dehydrogenase family protein [Clostridia bacterium]